MDVKDVEGAGYCLLRLVQCRDRCWAVVHTAMNLPVPYLLTGFGAVGFPSSTVLHAVCCLLYILVRRTTYCFVCCVVYWFVLAQCFLTALTALTELHTATPRCYRYNLYVISPYNCKCRPPYYKIIRVFCEVEHTHAQTDDAPCQLNHSFAHNTVLK